MIYKMIDTKLICVQKPTLKTIHGYQFREKLTVLLLVGGVGLELRGRQKVEGDLYITYTINSSSSFLHKSS